MEEKEVKVFLKEAGLKATAGRCAVFCFLLAQKHPVGVGVIRSQVKGVNKVTLYRMMQDFEDRGLITSHELGHGHLDYELADRPHHHHLVCQECGDIEDIHACKDQCQMEKLILKNSKKFLDIQKQTTTFFGTCNICAG